MHATYDIFNVTFQKDTNDLLNNLDHIIQILRVLQSALLKIHTYLIL